MGQNIGNIYRSGELQQGTFIGIEHRAEPRLGCIG